MKWLCSLTLLFAFSCKSQNQVLKDDNRLEVLIGMDYFLVANPSIQIIEDAKTLKALYIQINKTRKPGLPVPDIDFSKYKVLVAFIGEIYSKTFPKMYVQKENASEIIVSVYMSEATESTNFKSYPFCMYSLRSEAKQVVLQMDALKIRSKYQ